MHISTIGSSMLTQDLSIQHTQQTIQLLQTLWWTRNWKKSYPVTLTHSRLFGSALQSRTSNCFSTRPLRFSHQCPLPSISVHSHACTQNNFYELSDLSLCPLYSSWSPSTQVPPLLDKETLVPTCTAMGHPDPTGFRISLTHQCWFKREVLQGLPLHLPKPTLFFTDASLTRCGASWQTHHLSGLWSPHESSQHINWLELDAWKQSD